MLREMKIMQARRNRRGRFSLNSLDNELKRIVLKKKITQNSKTS